jgi:hypothetical protein
MERLHLEETLDPQLHLFLMEEKSRPGKMEWAAFLEQNSIIQIKKKGERPASPIFSSINLLFKENLLNPGDQKW